MKKVAIVILMVLFVGLTAYTQASSLEQKIIGTWIDTEGYTWIISSDDKRIYYSNGDWGSRGRVYTYNVVDSKLSINVDGTTQTYNISISNDGNTLNLTSGRNFSNWIIAGPGWGENRLTRSRGNTQQPAPSITPMPAPNFTPPPPVAPLCSVCGGSKRCQTCTGMGYRNCGGCSGLGTRSQLTYSCSVPACSIGFTCANHTCGSCRGTGRQNCSACSATGVCRYCR